ncbi:MAG TPA: histidine kinase, partial [Tenuifilaceae bacterium]|nr:histidine kinase [Tenuifilaceae bacterium]
MKHTLFKHIRLVLLHILFWIAVWFFFIYFFSYNSNDWKYIIWFSTFILPVTIAVTYFMVYYLIPKYLLTKKYVKFVLYSFYTFLVSANIIVPLIFGSFIFISNYNIRHMPPMSKNIVFVLIMVYLIVGIVGFVSLLNRNFTAISRNKELQNKILETQLQLKEQELQYLKMQIHPHFLFNTLNTIYGFALKQSKQTPELILMLSNLLDYILYQINKPKVSLKEEVLHIREYINMEKIRFQDSLKVIFISNEINENIQVAPMLLIPFVENAFKHGDIINGFLKIEVTIEVIDNKMNFAIRNTALNQEKENGKSGIGLDNIRKRLDMHYNNNYKLQFEKSNDWFTVNLQIFNLNAET